MRIVLFTNGEFPDDATRLATRGWAKEFAEELVKLGFETIPFGPAFGALQASDVVHSFGPVAPEDWYWLRQAAKGLVASPFPKGPVHPWPPRATAAEKFWHRLRGLTRPARAPGGRAAFLRAVDEYYLAAPNPAVAAREIAPIYARLGA